MEVPAAVTTLAASARQAGNKRLALRLGLVALFFVGFGFAMVPMYNVFCRLTGLNGKTNEEAIATDPNMQVDAARWVHVEFLSQTMPGVGLVFKPEQFSIRIHPGALTFTNYTVTNTTKEVFVGQAIPSITPAAAAQHFEKVECFCFSQQTFQPGETRTMPVVFVVNPKLDSDIGTVTLSYAFFEAVKAR